MVYEEYVKTNKEQFLNKVREISSLLQINPDWLMIVMYAESRINEKAVNPNGGATGLIQFKPSTAAWLGTTTSALKAMSNVAQLYYVYKYFKSLAGVGKIKSVYDLYMVTFFPAALGKADNWVMETSKLSAYTIANANKIIDKNKDGKITVAEFRLYVDDYLKKKTSI